MVQPGGVDDGGIGHGVAVLRVTPERIRIAVNVFLARAMAGLARDAEFARAGVEELAARVLAGLGSGGVAIEASEIPDLLRVRRIGFQEKNVVARHPAFFLKEISVRETVL